MIKALPGNIQRSPIDFAYQPRPLFNPKFGNFLKGTANTLNTLNTLNTQKNITPKGILKIATEKFPENTPPKAYVNSVRLTIDGKPTSFNGDELQIKKRIPKDKADLGKFVENAPPKSISGMRDAYEVKLNNQRLAAEITKTNDSEKIRGIQMKQKNNSITGAPATSNKSLSELHNVNEEFNKVYGGIQVENALKKKGRL